MSLEPGTKLGTYEILSPLGAGGMGEVYRARDTKLNRDVALKVLPEVLAHDAERMARFQREAQVLAALNHPNIAAIYGLEESGATHALVMELVEGQTLAERIVGAGLVPAQGRPQGSPLRDDALPIARQIAEALEYAHERGIIHRDLKPANIKITPEGTVKVLDFGLAKALETPLTPGPSPQGRGWPAGPGEGGVADSPTLSPTLSIAATQAGVILGTAAYMSPEQARGKPVDRRADIWAFGCVFFEMLGGRRPFEGETVSDTLAAVLKTEPDWSALPPEIPSRIRELLRRCLIKDPKQRLQAIGEARIAIEETLSGPPSPLAPQPQEEGGPQGQVRGSLLRRALPWALAALAFMLSLMLVLVKPGWIFRSNAENNVISFLVPPPEGTTSLPQGGFMQVSPDGSQLAFVGVAKDGKQMLWVRSLSDLTAKPLAGTEGAAWPFWSPDSRYLGFDADGKLKKVAVFGGPVQTLAEASAGSGTWNRHGVIVYANEHVLYRVPESGGTPVKVVEPDAAHHELDYVPQFLPDGIHFLFGAVRDDVRKGLLIRVGSLDSREVKNLMKIDSTVAYAPPGYLLYLQEGILMARRFDAKSLEFTSEATTIAENVGSYSLYPESYLSASRDVLAYQTRSAEATNQMVWFDGRGRKLGSVGEVGAYTNPAISPDGTKLAVGVLASKTKLRDIWVYDLKRGTGSPLTFDPAGLLDPVWSSDGNLIMFMSEHNGKVILYRKAATGLGSASPIYEFNPGIIGLIDVSADGRYAEVLEVGRAFSLALASLFGERKTTSFVGGTFNALQGRFSPDGRYVAYASNETGEYEIFVQTFPEQLGKWQVSNSGGTQPMWRHDGNELFYLRPDNTLMSADVKTIAGKFLVGTPKPLFQAQLAPGITRNQYAVSPDGQRFLMLVPAGEPKPTPITIVVNWPALLAQK
jgi:serine/threonine protein kinase